MLLQSILYGSLRFWFFTLTMPEEIIDMVESDAKEILWAAKPELRTNEEGTETSAKRYIKRDASYLPQKKGGGGIMHIRNHITAFQAQWIIKYLDPRNAPWKDVLDRWILNDDQLGRGTILCRRKTDYGAQLPDSCEYMKACFASFAELSSSSHKTPATSAQA